MTTSHLGVVESPRRREQHEDCRLWTPLISPSQSDGAELLITLIDEEPDGSPIVQKLEKVMADVISNLEPVDQMLNQRLPRSIKSLISNNDASNLEKTQEAKKAFSLDALSARQSLTDVLQNTLHLQTNVYPDLIRIGHELLASIEADHGSFRHYIGIGQEIMVAASHRSSKSTLRDKEPKLVKLKSALATLENTSENLRLETVRAKEVLNDLENLIQYCHDPTASPTARQPNLGPLCSEVDVGKLKESFAKQRAKYLALS
ncbi:MAG: hypothetical protein LQ337_003874 [Flavoplaca oasis]|nr:MAG: hypothetical protein LQ337_003874 [Flavoplaca oasis]